MTDKPTCEELFEEDKYQEVERRADDSWRHGSYVDQVFERLTDQTYWLAKYVVSTDGETHGLRDGEAGIIQVWRRKIEAFEYVSQPPEGA